MPVPDWDLYGSIFALTADRPSRFNPVVPAFLRWLAPSRSHRSSSTRELILAARAGERQRAKHVRYPDVRRRQRR
jgi:hypothetical protein